MLLPGLQEKCLGILRKICGRLGLLPRSIKIQPSYDKLDDPLRTGGYADIWKGQYLDCQVAVKVLRACAGIHFQKINRVGARGLLETAYLQADCYRRRDFAGRPLLGKISAIQMCYHC